MATARHRLDGKLGEMKPDTRAIQAAIAALMDEYRVRCLWFLRADYTPVTAEAQRRVLGYIERYGDLEAFRRASTLRRWLSPLSNETSAG